jgi:hypothetical protein
VAICALAYGMYFRRHGRRDLLLDCTALNVGVFSAVSLLASQSVELGLGFGLFAILSIIRLRLDATSLAMSSPPTASPGLLVVETKSANGMHAADRTMRSLGIRSQPISKYCLATAALHPHLRPNPWLRAYRAYFDSVTGLMPPGMRPDQRRTEVMSDAPVASSADS